MYIIKNALKCIGRAKARNILIGIIALVIAVSACIGLSIRQAATSAKADTLEGMTVTATISFDRRSMMNNMERPEESGEAGKGNFDKDKFSEMMGNDSSLTLEEYKTYAAAESVKDFYYTLTASFNGNDDLEPVTTDSEEEVSGSSLNPFDRGENGRGGMMGGAMNSGEFTVVGYSSDLAMTEFESGNTTMSQGAVFEEGTTDYNCIISEELATYNSISLNDTITLCNVNSDSETYTLTVVGIYKSEETNEFSMSMFDAVQDPANKIYMSATALQDIISASETASSDTAITGMLSGTYVFADANAYYSFEEEVRALGLDESYTVSSTDITAFENSLTPLNTLSDMAGWFLIVILIIGSVILIVLNIFNVRERKYEIGVLTAMGMKKYKVALQFVTEILAVTMVAIIIGAAIGAVSSVPVTNALLSNQIESQQENEQQRDNNFGRPNNMGGFGEGAQMQEPPQMNGKDNLFDKAIGGAANYVSEIDSAMNLTVLLQMLLIGLCLTFVASAASVLFVMRYDPLKILSNRD